MFRLLCFILLFSFLLTPDEALDEIAVVVLLFYFIQTCRISNYVHKALTLVVIEYCASNVRLSLPDMYIIKLIEKVTTNFFH